MYWMNVKELIDFSISYLHGEGTTTVELIEVLVFFTNIGDSGMTTQVS